MEDEEGVRGYRPHAFPLGPEGSRGREEKEGNVTPCSAGPPSFIFSVTPFPAPGVVLGC